MTAPELLEDWRDRAGLSVQQAADRLETTRQTYYNLRTGTFRPGAVLSSRIERETGIPAGKWGEG